MLSQAHLTHLLQQYGYAFVGGVIGLESLGIPLPGESMLIAAALYCAATGKLNIALVVASAILGACIGDNIGYAIGRSVGTPLLSRYGGYVGLTKERLRIGKYLFQRHGGKVVFFGRFVAILRTFAAVLAGANGMHWRSFLIFNIAGGTTWSSLYGFGAYLLGDTVRRLTGPLAVAFGVIAAIVIGTALFFARRNEHRLAQEARRATDPGAQPT